MGSRHGRNITDGHHGTRIVQGTWPPSVSVLQLPVPKVSPDTLKGFGDVNGTEQNGVGMIWFAPEISTGVSPSHGTTRAMLSLCLKFYRIQIKANKPRSPT